MKASKLLYTLITFVFFCNILCAQQKITVKVKSEKSLEEILPPDMLYEFTEYKNGRLHYIDGGIVYRDFNFNLVSKALLFKDKSGKVMELAYPEKVAIIYIDSCYWCRVEDGFGKIIYKNDNFEVIKYRETKCTDIKKEGAFGGVSTTSAVSSVSSILGNGNSNQTLSVIGEYDFEVLLTYYIRIGDELIIADARGFKKLFSSKKGIINDAIKSKKLDLSKEGDIMELMDIINN